MKKIHDTWGLIVIDDANIINVYITQYPGTTEASALKRCKGLLNKYTVPGSRDGVITLGLDYHSRGRIQDEGLKVAHYIERPVLDGNNC